MNKENLWLIGVLLIVAGTFFISLFLFSSEEIHFMSDLSQYTAGFLITGLIASFFGFIFTIICLDLYEEAEAKGDNTTKIRVVLIIVTAIFLILIGYLMYVNEEWEIEALIIEEFDQIFAFYPTFTLTSYNVMFATLLTFGIFVLPFVIAETGFLDDSPDEQNHNLEEDGYNPKKAEEAFDRFGAFLKKRIDKIKKTTIIKNYTLPIAIIFSILGSCLVVLPYFFLIDSPLLSDYETGDLYRVVYHGFIRGQLFLIGILLIVIGIILVRLYIRRQKKPIYIII